MALRRSSSATELSKTSVALKTQSRLSCQYHLLSCEGSPLFHLSADICCCISPWSFFSIFCISAESKTFCVLKEFGPLVYDRKENNSHVLYTDMPGLP